jgi:hypothetical protein
VSLNGCRASRSAITTLSRESGIDTIASLFTWRDGTWHAAVVAKKKILLSVRWTASGEEPKRDVFPSLTTGTTFGGS